MIYDNLNLQNIVRNIMLIKSTTSTNNSNKQTISTYKHKHRSMTRIGLQKMEIPSLKRLWHLGLFFSSSNVSMVTNSPSGHSVYYNEGGPDAFHALWMHCCHVKVRLYCGDTPSIREKNIFSVVSELLSIETIIMNIEGISYTLYIVGFFLLFY